MILQLDPPLPMDTPRGAGLAHFMIDYGPESHLMWVVFMDADGACWTVPNPEVRMQSNWSLQRRPAHKPFQSPPVAIVAPEFGGRATHASPVNGKGTRANGGAATRYHAASSDV